MLYSLLADEDIYFINLHAECALHTYSSEFYQYDIISICISVLEDAV